MRVRFVLVTVGVAFVAATPAAGAWGGMDAPVTPAGWRVEPAGREIGVSKTATGFQGPMNSALSPDGRWLLSASSGASRWESGDLFDLDAGSAVDTEPFDATVGPRGEAAFYGVAFSPDGRQAWMSGGGQNVVHALAVSGGRLERAGDIAAPYFPAGLAFGNTPRGPRLYVANNLASDATGAANPPGHEVTVIDPGTSAVIGRIDLGAALQPFGVTFTRDGRKAYVTNWMGRNVVVIDARTETKVGEIALDPDPLVADHPSAITENPRRDEVYTANSNSDTVSVIDTTADRVAATIPVGLVPDGPKGSNPVGLDVAPDGRTLYVALAGENALAVVDLDAREVRGFIPTSWYPADVDVTPDGGRLVVTNTNDSGAGPNPCGPLTPRPDCPAPGSDNVPEDQYSGTMIKGSLTVIDVPSNSGQLRALTRRVQRNNQARARAQHKPRALSAIKHVIYVIKENRTYDQVFGDLRRGNGDPSLVLFDRRSAPNHHALARRFGVYDDFYADAEVSADGHNWATQANATDYVDKTWPINYSPRPRGAQRAYDFEDVPFAQQFATEFLPQDPTVTRVAAAQTVGYLWDNAWAQGKTYRSYGEYTRFWGFLPTCQKTGHTSDTTHLHGHTDESYPGYSLRCSDHVDRFPEWEREFRQFEANGQLPALSIVRLPNDHTEGTRPGSATPEAYVADNDLALGKMVETLSSSRYWRDTVMLVTEDDAQNGPDHVDAHRTIALVISAYNHRGGVDSTHYDTASMIATAEDLLGLPPMSIVDQRAQRMWRLFGRRADPRPYRARQPEVAPFGDPAAPTNPASAPMARESASWDLSREDAAPEIALNRAIWKSVRGRHSRMPRPRHQHIIGVRPNDEADELQERGER
jgi:YVTN family beta-propeller protein